MKIHRIRVLENYTYYRKYIEKVLQLFGMQNAKPVSTLLISTLLAAHFKLSIVLSPQSKLYFHHSLPEKRSKCHTFLMLVQLEA